MNSIRTRTHYVKLILVGLLLTTVCGCNAVISKRPVGDKPAKLVAKDWEGNWASTDGMVKVKVVDADRGLLKLFWVEDGERGMFMKTADVEIRESGDWLFANTKADEKGDKGGPSRGFVFGRIKNENRQIILWVPDDKLFKQLAKDGVLPGRLDGEDLLLDELRPQQVRVITSGERGVLFAWDKPVVFEKVGN